MQKGMISVFLSLLMLFSTACNTSDNPSPGESGTDSAAPPAVTMEQTGQTIAVPAEYMTPTSEQGTVVELSYDSKDYARDSSDTTKTAYVYFPYGYDETDEETRYDILYLMHGWGGSEGEYFTIGNDRIKNMLDRMIENGEIPSVIVVSPTFYNANSQRDFSSSIGELREFHQDFINHLMPAVEGKYHTYAESTSEEDLIASHDHRAFGGFLLALSRPGMRSATITTISAISCL